MTDSNAIQILAIASYLISNPTIFIEIGVHRDYRGSAASSQRPSQKRAESIRLRLINLGIAPNRIIAKGYGESLPFTYDNILLTCAYIIKQPKEEQEKLHALNRRIQIFILTKE